MFCFEATLKEHDIIKTLFLNEKPTITGLGSKKNTENNRITYINKHFLYIQI